MVTQHQSQCQQHGPLSEPALTVGNTSPCLVLPLQFSFKNGISTTQCTHSLLEIVDYYNYNKSDEFVLMLDASKAFDMIR